MKKLLVSLMLVFTFAVSVNGVVEFNDNKHVYAAIESDVSLLNNDVNLPRED